MKKKNKRAGQEEIQVVKVKAVSEKAEAFKILDNKMGMFAEIGLVTALSVFCVCCFITGMELPVAKLGLFIEIICISILFWFTFRINRGSGYIFSGELILYGICSFFFRKEISQGLAAIINVISEKVMMYYNISLPLFEETGKTEQHMKAFLAFVIVMIVGMTAYAVVNKTARFFVCIIQFPIALGCLLVGFLPNQFYFLGFVAAIAVFLTMPKYQVPYVKEKKTLQSMTVGTTALVLATFVLFLGILTILVPKKKYEIYETAEYRDQLQEQIQNSFLGKIKGYGSGSAVGGLSHGQLGRTGSLKYTGRKCLEVDISGDVQLPLYLKSYVGKKYENDHWEEFDGEQQEIEQEIVYQMENGEELGAVWMELFSDMSDWFSEEAFAQYVETDISEQMLMSSLSSWYDPDEERETVKYKSVRVRGYADGYSYKSLQAILGQKPTTIFVRNIAFPFSENFVPYGRILKKDKEQNDAKSYTGYPNLNLYVKGGMEGYGYSSGNFIEGMLERYYQSKNFVDQCIASIPENDREKIWESDITLEELIQKVQQSGETTALDTEDGISEQKLSIQNRNGYYRMSASDDIEYILYFKSELKLKDVKQYMEKIQEYVSDKDRYEEYVGNYMNLGEYMLNLQNICRNFMENSIYSSPFGYGNADMELNDIGKCVQFVTEYLSEHMEYSLEPGKLPEGENFINYYLFKQKKGYCSHFATIATNMFRILGVPARYVEGFIIKNEDVPKEGVAKNIQLKDTNAHAWVEIYVEGYGWVPVEVTPGYDNGIEADDFVSLLENWYNNNKDKDDKGENAVSTPAPTKKASQQQMGGQNQHKNSFSLSAKAVKWIKIVSTIIFACGMIVLLIWLRYVYVWKMRIRNHSHRQENGRICNYYARMEVLLRGIHVIGETDTLRELLNVYIQKGEINQKKALEYITQTADKKQWIEFIEIVNMAAYSNRDVPVHQLEMVRLIEEKMRKEVFTSISKVKILYYQYIRLL